MSFQHSCRFGHYARDYRQVIDVFSFLKESLTENVAQAVARRGGFKELVSRGETGPIAITVKFRESGGRLASYQLEIANDDGRPVVEREILKFRRGQYGRPWHFVDFSRGHGSAITNEAAYGQEGATEERKEHLLYDPRPHPLLAVEEPENQLYPELLRELSEEFRDCARRGGQVFVSTHSPEFINGTELDEIYWLVKQDGFTTIRRAGDVDLLQRLIDEGDSLGDLWRQGLFEGAGPR